MTAINIRGVPTRIKQRFKRWCYRNDKDMKQVLVKFMTDYVNEHDRAERTTWTKKRRPTDAKKDAGECEHLV